MAAVAAATSSLLVRFCSPSLGIVSILWYYFNILSMLFSKNILKYLYEPDEVSMNAPNRGFWFSMKNPTLIQIVFKISLTSQFQVLMIDETSDLWMQTKYFIHSRCYSLEFCNTQKGPLFFFEEWWCSGIVRVPMLEVSRVRFPLLLWSSCFDWKSLTI